MATDHDNPLGSFLKDRRARIDPVALGFPATRRRTPGLRREEVAQRANISTTWYTWLERGRGGDPSAAALDRIARALLLTDIEREYLFLLALGEPPPAHYPTAPNGAITPRLQRVLDALDPNPAFVKTLMWDVVAWNAAATAVLADYGALPPAQRNTLRLIFCDPVGRAVNVNWQGVARHVVAAFRADAARAGNTSSVKKFVDELSRASAEFAALWRDTSVGIYGEGEKPIQHPIAGRINFEYSAFVVDGRRDLSLVILTPETASDAKRMRAALRLQSKAHE